MTAADGNQRISWENVAKALAFYQERGYRYVEAPWVVSDLAIRMTLPAGLEATRCQQGALVGSAEQSFVQLMLDGRLPPGKYVAATPCFRDENPVTLLHRPYFFKVELIEVEPVRTATHTVWLLALDALGFFQSLPGGATATIVDTDDGYDIELHGVELGSYGRRCINGLRWVYGTGYADPRFTTVTSKEE